MDCSDSKRQTANVEANVSVAAWRLGWEWSGLGFLALTAIWLLRISWRKWPDPLVDFGRELYLPWRMSQGAVLYRDLDTPYGPLSYWFNALVFRITGAGYMHLVWVNLVIYLAIAALIYRGVRMGWGRLAALAGTLTFVVVFSFSQLVGIGNYNFVCPYSHESVHGFLLVLILIHLWVSWWREPRRWKVVVAGSCCGLCLLLKAEIILVAAIVSAGVLAWAFLQRDRSRSLKEWVLTAALFVPSACAPPVIATILLWRQAGCPLATALLWANMGWAGVFVHKGIVSTPLQMEFLGLADIPGNLSALVIYGGLSVGFIAGLAAICRRMPSGAAFKFCGPVVVIVAGLASFWLPWMGWGVTFPAWLCVALFIALRQKTPAHRRSLDSAANSGALMRWLFLLAAGAFLVRMCLNPRIFQYGYFQAALAGVVTVTTAFRAAPDLFGLRNGRRILYTVSLSVFLGLGLWGLEERSRNILSYKTQPVAEGADRLFGYSSELNANPSLIEGVRTMLSARADGHTLLVIPEGVMLNYLLRKPTPTKAYNFTPDWLDRRDQVLDGLQKTPPDYVVVISRDLREFGVDRFGDSPEHGEEILRWIQSNYHEVWHAGGDPLDMSQRGAVVLQKTNKSL